MLGTPIDLSGVTCDKYVVAGMTDHITPVEGRVQHGATFGGDTRFVLSSSGHIQSLINPPGNPKAKFFLNPELPANADAWLADAQTAEGFVVGQLAGVAVPRVPANGARRRPRSATSGTRRLRRRPEPTSWKHDRKRRWPGSRITTSFSNCNFSGESIDGINQSQQPFR